MSHLDRPPGTDALVGRKHDSKAVDGVAHVIGEVVFAANGVEQETLFADAQLIMIGPILDRDLFIGFGEGLIGPQPRVVDADGADIGVRMNVG